MFSESQYLFCLLIVVTAVKFDTLSFSVQIFAVGWKLAVVITKLIVPRGIGCAGLYQW